MAHKFYALPEGSRFGLILPDPAYLHDSFIVTTMYPTVNLHSEFSIDRLWSSGFL